MAWIEWLTTTLSISHIELDCRIEAQEGEHNPCTALHDVHREETEFRSVLDEIPPAIDLVTSAAPHDNVPFDATEALNDFVAEEYLENNLDIDCLFVDDLFEGLSNFKRFDDEDWLSSLEGFGDGHKLLGIHADHTYCAQTADLRCADVPVPDDFTELFTFQDLTNSPAI